MWPYFAHWSFMMPRLRNMTLLRKNNFLNFCNSTLADKASLNIYTYYELKVQFGFNAHKFFWIRQRKFRKTRFCLKCVGKHIFLTSNSESALNFASNDMDKYMIHFARIGKLQKNLLFVKTLYYVIAAPEFDRLVQLWLSLTVFT